MSVRLKFYCFLYILQYYIADKIHCVWISDGDIKVLFESRDFTGPEHLGSAEINFIINRELVFKYLDNIEYIPHIQTMVTMMPTAELKVKN